MTPERRCRVAYFMPPSPDFAGVERVVHDIASELADAFSDSFDVHVIFATNYDEDLLRDAAYTKHVLGVRRLRGLGTAIRSCVARQRFDVFVCAQVEPSVVTWLATRGLRLPVFLAHLHGNPRVEEQRGTRRTRAAFALFRHVVGRRIAGTLVVSPSLGRYTAEFLTPGSPVFFLANPVREFDVPERAVNTDGAFRFVSVARLAHQKGHDVLLRAIAMARPRLPDFRVTLVGSGPEERTLKDMARDLAVDDVVIFTGYTTDPAQHLVDADCFVLASRWEGFGVALVEALRVGLPVLATTCDFGPADLITEPALGRLVASEDAAALADGLVAETSRRNTAEDVARRKAAADGYSRAVVVPQHAAVLRHLSGRAPSRRRTTV
jgi:glycosyltransferase involved in cell wall biosynthesis